MVAPVSPAPDPPQTCKLCPRLTALRHENRIKWPDWFNAPVPSFGDNQARLLIVGLAPGLQGANRTGRPFTGDFAGDLLYATLAKHGFSRGCYASSPDDGLTLADCMITNAVRCLPPENKPIGVEIANCQPFLQAQINALPQLQAVLALGKIAHDSVVRLSGLRMKDAPFAHGAHHKLQNAITLYDSYHCSRYNTNTRRLTPEMFDAVFSDIRKHLR